MQNTDREARKRSLVDALLKGAGEKLQEQDRVAGASDVAGGLRAKAVPVLRLAVSKAIRR